MEPFCNHFDQFGFEFDVLQYSGVDLVRFLSRPVHTIQIEIYFD